jgi:hypothetical protein
MLDGCLAELWRSVKEDARDDVAAFTFARLVASAGLDGWRMPIFRSELLRSRDWKSRGAAGDVRSAK